MFIGLLNLTKMTSHIIFLCRNSWHHEIVAKQVDVHIIFNDNWHRIIGEIKILK